MEVAELDDAGLEALVSDAAQPRQDLVKTSELCDAIRKGLDKLERSEAGAASYRTYRSLEDPAFQSSLLSKKEFYDRKVARIPDVIDYEKAAQNACANGDSDVFELSESQAFVRNFLSPRTPYNGLLLYHDVGVGKTCSAISIAERFPSKRVIVIAPSNVQTTFLGQMFDVNKLVRSDDGTVIASRQCTGTTFLKASGDAVEMEAHAQKMISQRYTFTGFNKFANAVGKLSDAEITEAYSNHVIIIDEAHNLRSQKESGTKPAYRALKKVIHVCPGTKIVMLTATPMYNDAREIVDLINLLLMNDRRQTLKRSLIFADDGTLLDGSALAKACVGYVSHVSGRNPLRFPVLLDPTQDNDAAVVLHKSLPIVDVSGETIRPSMRIQRTCIVGSVMSRMQYSQYIAHAAHFGQKSEIGDDEAIGSGDEDLDGLAPTFRPGFETSNIAFPGRRDARGSSAMFWSCFRRSAGKEFAVEYTSHPGFLSPENVAQYSCKFKTIIDRILSGTGVVFVYSRFLWAGLVPLAIALEHAGFSRHSHRNILANQETSSINGSYIMLTSDVRLCSKSMFAKDLEAAVAPGNASGRIVRVILACGVATEGIDFKCVRSVHLLDPWYHSNKVAQIIGRASRTCSHASLPPSLRNVTVYMHASLPPADVKDAPETVDIHALRLSEFKQYKINVVERLLRAVSVDCELNRHAQQDEALGKATIDIQTAQGTLLQRFKVAKNLSASLSTCIVDKTSNAAAPGEDHSTHDPWYHAVDSIDRHLDTIFHAFRKNHWEVMGFDDILPISRMLLGDRFDERIFVFALQKGVESKQLQYRGGVYIGPKEMIENEDDKCTRRIIPVIHSTRNRASKSRSLTRNSNSRSLTGNSNSLSRLRKKNTIRKLRDKLRKRSKKKF